MWIGGAALLAVVTMGVAVVAHGGAWQEVAGASSMPMGDGMPMAGGKMPMHEDMPMQGNATMAHDRAMCLNASRVSHELGSELMWGRMTG